MKPVQKLLTTCLWIVFVLAMVSVIGAGLWTRGRSQGGENAIDLNDPDDVDAQRDPLAAIAEVPEFSLIDQTGGPVTRDALAGKVWIASFVFTRCAGPCPIMTGKMSSLQKTISDPRVNFVSVTVDPENDTPAVLEQYAKKFHADQTRWHFLTAPKGDKEAVFALARGMLISALPAQGNDPIIHSEKFVLVDSAGKIRKYYDSKDSADIDRLISDVKTLTKEARAVETTHAASSTRPVHPLPAPPLP
jgi:cytochrome oxidase Cu insertion factor (SCO1/SenC/PrrC family)